MIDAVRPAAASNGNALEVDLDAAIEADPLRLRQCLLNVLSNSAKFTRGGSVRLSVRDDHGPAEGVVFEVADTGIGMSEDHLARLFTPFEQADDSTSKEYGGTGLGMAITARLVKLMGGRIHVASAPGAGTTVTLAFPVHAVAAGS